MDAISKLAQTIIENPTPTTGLPQGSQPIAGLYGVVKSIQSGSVTVTLAGSTTQVAGVKYLGHYAPAVNDTVELLAFGSDMVILGTLQGAGRGGGRFSALMYAASTTSTIATAADQVCGFDTALWDTYGGVAVTGAQNGASSAHFVLPVDGVYTVKGVLAINNSDAHAINDTYIAAWQNPAFATNTLSNNRGNVGEFGWRGTTTTTPAVADNPVATFSHDIIGVTGDKIFMGLFHNAGVNRTTYARIDLARFSISLTAGR